ncbi:MAG: hypothetical protein U0798_05980 [Gemmataceae bacterium]
MNTPTSSITLPQLSLIRDSSGPRVLGRSPEIPFEVEEQALSIVLRFGARGSASTIPAGTFLLKSRTGDRLFLGSFAESPGLESTLLFRLTYFAHKFRPLVDPFRFAERFPANGAKGELPLIDWEPVPEPHRPVEAIRELLKTGDSPLLLGVTQALLDGCKIAISTKEASPEFVQQVWQLMPEMARWETTFTTFAASVELNVDLAVVAEGVPIPPGFLTAEQARDYPEGRYELSLQLAAEEGNQHKLDKLFSRKTSNQVLRMVITMIVFAFIAIVIIRLL